MRYAVILLPGIITPAGLTFGALTRALGDTVPLILRDLAIYDRGAPPADYSFEMEIDAIQKTADEAGLERFHLGGFSGGGAISAAFAARHPERLVSLLLMEPAWFGNEGQDEAEQEVRAAIVATEQLPYEESLAAFASLNVADGVEISSPPRGDPPAWMEHRPAGIAAIAPACRDHFLDLDALRRFPRPVLYMRGGLSNPAIYVGIEKRAAAVFPDFEVAFFPDRHHFDPPHRSEADRTAAILQAFWERAEEA